MSRDLAQRTPHLRLPLTEGHWVVPEPWERATCPDQEGLQRHSRDGGLAGVRGVALRIDRLRQVRTTADLSTHTQSKETTFKENVAHDQGERPRTNLGSEVDSSFVGRRGIDRADGRLLRMASDCVEPGEVLSLVLNRKPCL